MDAPLRFNVGMFAKRVAITASAIAGMWDGAFQPVSLQFRRGQTVPVHGTCSRLLDFNDEVLNTTIQAGIKFPQCWGLDNSVQITK